MSPVKTLGTLAMIGVLLGVSGCCTYRRSYAKPTAKRLIDEVGKQDAPLKTVRGKAKVDRWTKKGRVKLKVYVLATRQGKLRFEATLLDNALLTLISDGARFLWIDHKNSRVFSGEAKPCNIARAVGVKLSAAGVARALVGGVPVVPHDASEIGWSKCLGAEILILKRKGRVVQKIFLKRRGAGSWRLLKSVGYDAKGKVAVRLTFEDYRKIGGRSLPRTVKLIQPGTGDAIIRYSDQEINVQIPGAAFQLEAPGGLPEQTLYCDE